MRWIILALGLMGCGEDDEPATTDASCHEIDYDKVGQAKDCPDGGIANK